MPVSQIVEETVEVKKPSGEVDMLAAVRGQVPMVQTAHSIVTILFVVPRQVPTNESVQKTV